MDKIFTGDALKVLKSLRSGSANMRNLSPYFGLRDYGVKGQLGLEDSPHTYVAKLVELFAQVRRVLRDDGTLWLRSKLFLFKTLSSLGDFQKAPEPTVHMLTEPWERVGYEAFRIDEP